MDVALQTNLLIAGERFQAAVLYGGDGLTLEAGWKNNKNHVLDLQELVKETGIDLPDFLNFRLEMGVICLRYGVNAKLLLLNMAAKNSWKLTLGADLIRKRFFFFLNPGFKLDLSGLPMMGTYLKGNSYLSLSYVQMIYEKGKGTEVFYLLESRFSNRNLSFGSEAEAQPGDLKAMGEVLKDSPEEALKENPKWKTVNKTIGPCFIRRVKGSFEDGTISAVFDASITIAVLTLDFLELNVGIRLGQSFSPAFGLKGLCVGISKPPLLISGGLYLDKKQNLYSGQLAIRYDKFSFLGLGSYRPEGNGHKASFFAYLLLEYRFGGPPCFSVTGLAAGFGVNQRIRVPELQKVEEFPFIRAAVGKKTDKSAEGMLSSMSEYIVPADESYFLTAGLRFESFGMVESIVLLNAEFGQKFELSLLGLSTMDLPPKTVHPVIHGSLALRAVFNPEEGILQIEGALTKDAYLFSKDCHLAGGFAFYSWFHGSLAGDFVLTVGGYHPAFKKKSHYPSADRVSINWRISNELSLTGEAYFALTPSCLMAGGRLSLDYHAGKLSAWCRVSADFLIGWNPFYYDIEISASIGASYRLDLLFIHHTFTLELSASMHFWGPEFAGQVHVRWFIISFTIKFNDKPKKPDVIPWKDFKELFLNESPGDVKPVNQTGDACVKVRIEKGSLGEKNQVYFVNASQVEITVESELPCEQITYNGTKCIIEKVQPVGIVPMGVESLKAALDIKLFKKNSSGSWKPVGQNKNLIRANLPSALWDTKTPDLNSGMIENLYTGCRIKSGFIAGDSLPEKADKWYSLLTLQENEKHIAQEKPLWNKVNPIPVKKEEEVDYSIMETNERRDEWLRQLSADYGVRTEAKTDTGNFTAHVEELLFAPFLCEATGTRRDEE